MNTILPTIGPATENINSLKKIIKFSNLVRINGSHNSLSWHIKISNKIKLLNKENKILLDIPGIKPRTANIKNIKIKKNEQIIFYYYKKIVKKNYKSIKLTNKLPTINKHCKSFSISDGQYQFSLKSYEKNYILGKSKDSFTLEPKKGLNIPFAEYDDRMQKKIYLNFLKKFKKVKFDAIGLSFIQNARILIRIKKEYPRLVIVAKIENYKGLKNIAEICKVCDVIMIDRGDLSAEIGEENLFSAIIEISKITKSNGKSLIMATENIESMILRKSPSKSEIVSLGLSLGLKTDKIMLSDETATAKNWFKIINWLNKYIKFNKSKSYKKNIKISEKYIDIFWNTINKMEGLPVIIFSKKGFALERLSQLKADIQLKVFTDNKKIATICEFRSNTKAYLIKKFDSSKKNIYIYRNIKKNKKEIFKTSNEALLIYISYPRKNSRANSFTLISKKDFI